VANLTCLLFSVLAGVSAALGLFPAMVKEAGAPPSEAINIMDMSGREVAFDRTPRNVVIYYCFVQASFATIDGTMQHIAGMPTIVWARAKGGLLSHVFPLLQVIPSMGEVGEPDVELVLRRQPDAVLIWKSSSEMLEKIGFRGLVEIDYDQSNYKNARLLMWQLVGAIAGKNDRAQELLDRFHHIMEELQGHLFQVKGAPPRIMMPFESGDGRWSMASKYYYLNETFEMAGGINVARDLPYYSAVDFEQIYRLDPDIILLHYFGNSLVPQRLYDDPRWQPVRAVHDHRVYHMPMNFLDNVAVDEPLILTWLTEILHPEMMPRLTRAAYREAYTQVYHYDLTDDEIDRALFMKENCGSAGYERFARDHGNCLLARLTGG